jgi:hypothetical protein
MGRRCGRLMLLLADLKEEKRHWNLKEAQNCTLWGTCFERILNRNYQMVLKFRR